MPNQNTNKTYCKRGHEFTLENTYVEPSTLKRQCRICNTVRSRIKEKNRNRTPESRRIYRLENIDRFLELERKQYRENPEREREKQRRWMQKHYSENPERFLEQSRQWRKENPDKIVAARHRRRSKSLGVFTSEQWAKLKILYKNACLGCHRSEEELIKCGLKLTPDHVIPISLGGSNLIDNIQPLCFGKGGCNNRKSNKHIDFRNTNTESPAQAGE